MLKSYSQKQSKLPNIHELEGVLWQSYMINCMFRFYELPHSDIYIYIFNLFVFRFMLYYNGYI